MIFPPKEEAKYLLLQNKLDEITKVAKSMLIKEKYDTRFKHIIRILSSKLVSCNTEIMLHTRNEQNWWQDSSIKLTRRGLVQSFNSRNEKYKLLKELNCIINPSKASYSVPINKTDFIKKLSCKIKIQDKAGHARLLEALDDIYLSGFYGLTKDVYAKNIEFKETKELPIPLIVQKNYDLFARNQEGGDNDDLGNNSDEIKVKYIRFIIDGYGIEVELRTDTNSLNGFCFYKQLSLTDYFRISEPDIYNKIIEELDQTKIKLQNLIKTAIEKYDKVCEKYSDILAIQALIEDSN